MTTEIELTCPYCRFSRPVAIDKIPSGVARVTCPECGGRFPFPTPEEPSVTAEAAVTTCPVCGENQPPSESCNGCGLNFALYAQKQQDPVSAAARPKAGFWIRVVAAFIDSAAVSLVQGLLTALLVVIAAWLQISEEGSALLGAALWLFGAVLSLAYYVFFTGYCGQTPGKMALRIKVIRTDGSELNYGRSALREIPGKLLSGLILGAGYLMVAFDPQKQGLHDRIADTYVIKL